MNERQLDLIREFATVAESLGIAFWLRGGWAMDLFLGRLSRDHADIDLFIWASDADRLVDALLERGYDDIGGPPPERQRNLRRSGSCSTSRSWKRRRRVR